MSLIVFGVMMANRAYLLLDHMNSWKSYMKACAESIRQRLMSLECLFTPAGIDGGSNVIAFLENNTNVLSSR